MGTHLPCGITQCYLSPGRGGVLPCETRRVDSGGTFLGRGQLTPSLPARGFGSAVRSPSRVCGTAPAAQRFSCSLMYPGSLFCYDIKNKQLQLQKALNLTVRGYANPPRGQELHEQGELSTVAGSVQPPDPHTLALSV